MAVVTSQYFGIVGNGGLHILHLDERGMVEVGVVSVWPSGLCSCDAAPSPPLPSPVPTASKL